MKKKNTIAEVARAAGVSLPTVSRVLNNRPDVSPETRKRVEAVIAEMGFQPSAVARSLDSRETHTICLVFLHYEPRDLFADPYLAGVTSGIVDTLTPEGYFLLTYPVPDGGSYLQDFRQFLHSGRVDGLIVHNAYIDDPILELISGTGLPYVALDLEKPIHPYSAVVAVDNTSGIQQLVNYLVAKGHRSIGHVYGDLRRNGGMQRAQAFRKAMSACGLAVREEWIQGGTWYQEGGASGIERIFNTQERPTAVVAATDLMAMGVIEHVRSIGLQVPKDLSVTGFDDVPFAGYLNPPLTTVRMEYGEFGSTAAKCLIALINTTEKESKRITVPVKLVVRDSVETKTLPEKEALH